MAKESSPYSFDEASVYIDGKQFGKATDLKVSFDSDVKPIKIPKIPKNGSITIAGTMEVMNPFYDWFWGTEMGYIQRAIAWLRKLIGREKYHIDTFWGHANFVKNVLKVPDFDFTNPDSRKGEPYHKHEDDFIVRWGGTDRDKKIGFVIQRPIHALQQRRYKLKKKNPLPIVLNTMQPTKEFVRPAINRTLTSMRK